MENRVLVGGASVSAGAGLAQGSNDSKLWVNQLVAGKFNTADVDNISVIGDDNRQVFIDVAAKLLAGNYTNAIVCWQTADRVNVNFGLETYPTRVCLTEPHKSTDAINLVGGAQVSTKQINQCKDTFLRFRNLHWYFKDLVGYTSILNSIAARTNTKIQFVNVDQPWSKDYFVKRDWQVPSELDSVTQEVLQSEYRSDSEVRELYNLIHEDYQQAGTICHSSWLNLYEPLKSLQVDYASDTDKHPGYKSQDAFTNFLLDRI